MREILPEPPEKKQRGREQRQPSPRRQEEPVTETEAEAEESPGDEQDEINKDSDEELPELADSEVDPEELRAEPELETEAEAIEYVYPYLREKRKELRATPEGTDPNIMRDEGDSNELASALKKAKVTGKGVDMVEKITSLLAVEDKYDLQRVGFLQVRIGEAKKRKTYRKPPRPKDGDKNLRFSECPPEIQKGLRNSRAVEWQKRMNFNARIILETQELNR